MGLLAKHLQKQRKSFPDTIETDKGLSFCDNDDCSSASELDDLVET